MPIKTLLVIALLTLPLQLTAQDVNGEIVVTGIGKANARPDVGVVRIEVSRTAGEPGAAMTEVTEDVTNVLAIIRAYGVLDDDIETTRLSLGEKWELNDSQRTFVGHQATNELSVEVRDLTGIGDLIATLAANGATDIDGPYFEIEDTVALRDEARRKAVLDAVATARLLADAAGVTLGSPLLITDGTRTFDRSRLRGVVNESEQMEEPMVMEEPIMESFGDIAEDGAPVVPGTIERTEHVEVIFSIAP